LKTEEEIELIRKSSLLVAKTHAEMAKMIQPGVNTGDLDRRAEEFIRDHGGVPSFKGFNGFPYTLCVSINEEVVHGFANERILNDGDIVSVDCGVFMNDFHGDSAYTYEVGEVAEDKKKLLEVTKACLRKGIDQARSGLRIGDIGFAVQQEAERHGYTVVRELVGHGVGRNLHEAPEVPNYGKRGRGSKLREGMVIAIEPMINMGKREVRQAEDGWTIYAVDRKPSAHFEHTIAIRKGEADVLSSFEFIEEVLKAKETA